jgi:hypothetical protein
LSIKIEKYKNFCKIKQKLKKFEEIYNFKYLRKNSRNQKILTRTMALTMTITMKLSEIMQEQKQEQDQKKEENQKNKENEKNKEKEESVENLELDDEDSERIEEYLDEFCNEKINELQEKIRRNSMPSNLERQIHESHYNYDYSYDEMWCLNDKNQMRICSPNEADELVQSSDFDEQVSSGKIVLVNKVDHFVNVRLDPTKDGIQYYDPDSYDPDNSDVREKPLEDRYCPPMNREFVGIDTTNLSRAQLSYIIGTERCVLKAICRDTGAEYIYHVKNDKKIFNGDGIVVAIEKKSLIAIWGYPETLEEAYNRVQLRINKAMELIPNYYKYPNILMMQKIQDPDETGKTDEIGETDETEETTSVAENSYDPDNGEVTMPYTFCPPINRDSISISTKDVPKEKIGFMIGKEGNVFKAICSYTKADYIYWIGSEKVIRIWGKPETLKKAEKRVRERIVKAINTEMHY